MEIAKPRCWSRVPLIFGTEYVIHCHDDNDSPYFLSLSLKVDMYSKVDEVVSSKMLELSLDFSHKT